MGFNKRALVLAPALLLMLAVAGLHAAPPQSPVPTEPEQQAPTTEPKAPVSKKPKPTRPSATFTPSERIGADSAVSFPVDI